MSWRKDANKGGGSSLRTRDQGLSTIANSSGREGYSPVSEFYELEPAIVVAIILDNADARKIGVARVRPVYSYSNTPEVGLPFASPLDSNIKNYPLIGEIVITVMYAGKLYYSQRLNFLNAVNENRVKDGVAAADGSSTPGSDYSETSIGNPNSTSGKNSKSTGGNYFKPDRTIKSLIPMEGDIIYEGRFGNSIRFGGTVDDTVKLGTIFKQTWSVGKKIGSPILIIRNGQKDGIKDTDIAPLVEDINKDKSSIYLTSDQTIPLIPSSKNQKTYRGSAPAMWDGAQVLVSSDRIVLNAKKEGMFFFSPQTFGFATDGTFNIDATRLFIVNSQRINFGLNASEPLVKGNAWLKIMIKLLVALQTETHPCPGGKSGFPITTVYSELIDELQDALSNVSWTE